MASHAMLALVASDEDAEHRRACARHRVLLSAKLVTTTGETGVKLRNLSTVGAMAEGDKLPIAGSDLILRRGALDIFATVVWNADHRCGLQFDEPLADDEVWSQVSPAPPPIVSQPIVHRRPGVRSSQLSREEREMLDAISRPAAGPRHA
jgi:hypothetical protein